MRVVIVGEGLPDFGGSGANQSELAVRLRRRGHVVAFASRWPLDPDGRRVRRMADAGVSILSPSPTSAWRGLRRAHLANRALTRLGRLAPERLLTAGRSIALDMPLATSIRAWASGDPFVIHLLGRETTQALQSLRKLRMPIVFSEFGQLENIGISQTSAPALQVDAFTADSRVAGDCLREIEQAPVSFIPAIGGFDRAVVTPPTGATSFGMLTRFVPIKRIHVAVEAMRLLDATLHIAGDGPLRGALMAGAPANVRFDGMVSPGHEVQEFLTARDALIITSRSEGTPVAALEAMSLSRPVIAPPIGSLPDIIIDGVSGLLFDGSVDGLASCLRKLLDHPALAGRLGAAARARWEQVAAPETVVTQYEQIYARLSSA